MSRIILSRYDSGEERVVVGFDRPLETLFWQILDEEGIATQSSGDEFTEHTSANSFLNSMPDEVKNLITWEIEQLLDKHGRLEYPDSNVQVDMTRS